MQPATRERSAYMYALEREAFEHSRPGTVELAGGETMSRRDYHASGQDGGLDCPCHYCANVRAFEAYLGRDIFRGRRERYFEREEV